MNLEWWHWAVAGVALMLAEIFVPAFVLVWFGLGALVVALITAVFPTIGLAPQLLLWIACSGVFVFLWFKIFRHAHHKTKSGTSSAQAVGEVGLLVSNVEPFQKGQVRFQSPLYGADVWECIADELIKAGERVKVVSVEGSILKITKTGGH